jgi:GABA(A) receptor-associated protein
MTMYKQSVQLSKRKADAEKVLFKYPSYIPVIVDSCDELSQIITKKKYLVPKNSHCSELLMTIRKNLQNKIACNKAIFVFCNNILIMPYDPIINLYEKYKDKEDNYLYLYLAYENTFGN